MSLNTEYHSKQLSNVIDTKSKTIKLKISSDEINTNWLNISMSQLKEIRNILTTCEVK